MTEGVNLMVACAIFNNYHIEYDPCEVYTERIIRNLRRGQPEDTIITNGEIKRRLIEATGMLFIWATAHGTTHRSFKDALIDMYDFYAGPYTKGEIFQSGHMMYPGDGPVAPLLLITHPDIPEIWYFYPNGVVGTVNTSTGDQWLTRMD